MAIINQLSGTDQLAAGDSVPFYSVAQGDTRRFTLSTLEAYMADANFVYRYFQTWAEFLVSEGWKDQDIFLVSADDTGTHNSVAGDVGEVTGQTPNVGVFRYSTILETGVRISDTDAQVAKYWAEQAAASAALATVNGAAQVALAQGYAQDAADSVGAVLQLVEFGIQPDAGIVAGAWYANMFLPTDTAYTLIRHRLLGTGTCDVQVNIDDITAYGPYATTTASASDAVSISATSGQSVAIQIENITGSPTALFVQIEGLPV